MSAELRLRPTVTSDAPSAPAWVSVHPVKYDDGAKRVLDVVLTLLALLALAPVFLAIAIAIRLDSPGSVIFTQVRVGRRGRPFRLYKFRSMFRDAEERRAELLVLNEASGPVFKMRRDPRITKVGRWLRRTSLDELPQLINVLRGEMSLVGPRPPLPEEVVAYRPSDAARLAVRPGLTCLWQVRGRSDVDFDTWMAYDREYISRMSVWLDIALLFRTVWVVVAGKGAY